MTMQASLLHRLVVFAITLCGTTLCAADYTSPYKVEFTFKQEDLIGDLLQGPRGIHLRPFKRGYWYASKASHALRIIPEGK